jgi:hypothetical protein
MVQVPEGWRHDVLDLESGEHVAKTPAIDCWPFGALSPDRRFIAARSSDCGGWMAYPLGEGSPRESSAIARNEVPLAWTKRGLMVVPKADRGGWFTPPVRISRIDLETGVRSPVATLGPAETPSGSLVVSLVVTPDENAVAYSYLRERSTLYLFDFRPASAEPKRQMKLPQ